MKIVVDGLRHRFRKARHSRDFLQGGVAYLLQTAEVAQQLGLALGAHARDVIEFGMQGMLVPQVLVIGNGEAVGFVAHALQEKQGRRIGWEGNGILAARSVELFIAMLPSAGLGVLFETTLGDAGLPAQARLQESNWPTHCRRGKHGSCMSFSRTAKGGPH